MLAEALRESPVPVQAAYLFGSRARGSDVPGSDVDIAVLLPAAEHSSALVGPLSTLTGFLERQLEHTVDLVCLRGAPPDLVHRILRDGDLVLDRDPEARTAFEVQARNLYFDLVPYLEQYRSYRAA